MGGGAGGVGRNPRRSPFRSFERGFGLYPQFDAAYIRGIVAAVSHHQHEARSILGNIEHYLRSDWHVGVKLPICEQSSFDHSQIVISHVNRFEKTAIFITENKLIN